MTDIHNIYEGVQVNDDEVEECEALGLRIHIEPVYVDGKWVGEHYYAAHPDWVENYLQSGGTWAYID